MNSQRLLKQSAFNLLQKKSIDRLTLKEILDEADISKQTFYNYYADKYDLGNQIYDDLFVQPFYLLQKEMGMDDWEQLYLNKYYRFLKYPALLHNLYSSLATGCTTFYEIDSVTKFDQKWVRSKGGDPTVPEISFSIEAKDTGGTYQMRRWILEGFKISPEQMIELFKNAIPVNLIKYY